MCKFTSEKHMFIHPSKILFLRKDSNFNVQWAFKTWQTSAPQKVVAATFEIFNGLNIHSYVSQPFRLHYYNAHLCNLHWNAHFLYFSATPFCHSFLHSMHCKIIYWLSNPLIYELIITFYLPLIYSLIIGGGKRFPPLIINS